MATGKYEASFLNELQKLNPKQAEAVQHIEGPVLVIAGPGTGKTQILSARIGNILHQSGTHVGPHAILCLTYTDAGAIAMRKRLLKFIGPEAHRVPIHTFHGFCNIVIQENQEWFGVRQQQPISELESIQLYSKLIDSIPLEHPLKRLKGDVYFDIPRLRHLFDTMKKEGWTPSFVLQQIQAYREEIAMDERFLRKRKSAKATSPYTEEYFDLLKRLQTLEDATPLYATFQKLMKENHFYDFNDMLVWVNDTFKQEEKILRKYQERYLYILVDEFQDTSGIQLDLLYQLADYWEKPNIFAVGDDDQSIYRFQGANIKNIVDFNFKYSPKVIVLEDNYRSSPSILDASTALIQQNKERLVNQLQGLDKVLYAKGENAGITHVPIVQEYTNPLQEEAGLIETLTQLHHNGVEWKDMAVLYRNHKKVDRIVQVLQRRNIPLSIKRKYNILHENLIVQLLEILKYLHKEQQYPDSGEEHLFKLLHFSFFEIDPRDIAHIVRYSVSNEYKKWRLITGSPVLLSGLPLRTRTKVEQLEENLSSWTQALETQTLQVLLEKILTYGNVFSWIMKSEDKTWYLQVVATFFDFLKEETAKRPDLTLGEWLSIIDQLKENAISLPLERSIHSEEGIQFITAHSSKGLEFDYVHILGANASEWESKRESGQSYFYPPTLTEKSDFNKEEDERRLFYVAMTRAKKQLSISYAATAKEDKPTLPSRFVTELLDSDSVQIQYPIVEESALHTFLEEVHSTIESPTITLMDTAFVHQLLDKYRLSVTHLNKYLKCPISFYFENILQVPSARTPSSGFGLAIHGALRRMYNAMLKSSPMRFPDKAFLIEAYEQELKLVKSHFTSLQYEYHIHLGKEVILPAYYDSFHTTWTTDTRVEYTVKDVEVDGVPIKGTIDKMEFSGNNVHVVDYKTGKFKPEKITPPSEKQPLGSDYWRQIVFYKILLENERFSSFEVRSGELDFVEEAGNKKSRFILPISSGDVELVKGQINEAYSKIMQAEFTQGCGKEDCTWCNFVKYNYTGLKNIPEQDVLDLG